MYQSFTNPSPSPHLHPCHGGDIHSVWVWKPVNFPDTKNTEWSPCPCVFICTNQSSYLICRMPNPKCDRWRIEWESPARSPTCWARKRKRAFTPPPRENSFFPGVGCGLKWLSALHPNWNNSSPSGCCLRCSRCSYSEISPHKRTLSFVR